MSTIDSHSILLVEDDIMLCSAVATYLEKNGYAVRCAHNGQEALQAITDAVPHIIVSDIRMPVMDGIRLLHEIRERGILSPVIITSGFPDLDSALQAIHHGVYDYVVKPYPPQMLLQKIRLASSSVSLTMENTALFRLVSLHETANKLVGMHNLTELMSFTLDSCLKVLDAQSGSIQMYDTKREELAIVAQFGLQSVTERSPMSDTHEWAISKWVVRTGRSLLMQSGTPIPEVPVQLERPDIDSALSVPLKVATRVIGVINLNRIKGQGRFTTVDLNTIEVFASQASIAISNAELYDSLNQKIKELSLVSQYSEELMTRVDQLDVIRCLFETVHRNFPIDIVAFLFPRKRFYEFLYWSRGTLRDDDVQRVRDRVAEVYSRETGIDIQSRRIKFRRLILSSPQGAGTITTVPGEFNHLVRVVWEDVHFGMTYFGAQNLPPNSEEMKSLLAGLVNQTRVALTKTKLYDDVKENYIRTIKALAIAVDAKDTYTHGHSENVMNIAQAIASEMQIGEKAIGVIRDAGLLHDIGKIGIPGTILNKPGPLTYEEFNGVMKTHATLGANIVKDVPFLKELYDLILSHHEHYDGTGYPEGLSGEQIPLGARILHVADAFEAMTSNRPYRTSLGKKEAVRRLLEEKGRQFDPAIVDAFMRVAQMKGWLD